MPASELLFTLLVLIINSPVLTLISVVNSPGPLLGDIFKNILLSAFKGLQNWNEKSKDYIIRVYNILHEKSDAEIKFLKPIEEAIFVDLKEDPLENQPDYKLDLDQGILKFNLESAKICTIKIRFK